MFWLKLFLLNGLLFGFSHPAKTAKTSHKLVTYWGQNSVSKILKDSKYNEKDLKTFCRNYKYDVINLSFLNKFFDKKNKDELPGFNFSFHCHNNISPEYPTLLRCREIEDAIKICQQKGIKILMSLGGTEGTQGFSKPADAVLFAYTVYNLLLAGDQMKKLRPFGRVILDGINLNIGQLDPTNNRYYSKFVKELRRIEKEEGKPSSLVTATTQCSFPDKYLGPEYGKLLGDTPEIIDEVYVKFYNNSCHGGNERVFNQATREWLSFSHNFKGPAVYVGLPASQDATTGQGYRNITQARKIFESLEQFKPFAGFMLWDASFDQNNQMEDGRHYSDIISNILKGNNSMLQTTEPTTTTATTTTTIITTTTAAGVTTTTKQTPKVEVSCHGSKYGMFPHPTSCAKFVHCSHGIPFIKVCRAPLYFNPKLNVCDWPRNVRCHMG